MVVYMIDRTGIRPMAVYRIMHSISGESPGSDLASDLKLFPVGHLEPTIGHISRS